MIRSSGKKCIFLSLFAKTFVATLVGVTADTVPKTALIELIVGKVLVGEMIELSLTAKCVGLGTFGVGVGIAIVGVGFCVGVGFSVGEGVGVGKEVGVGVGIVTCTTCSFCVSKVEDPEEVKR